MDTRPHRFKVALTYEVTNLINGHRYVGVTSKTAKIRWRDHVSNAFRGRYQGRFHRAIRKYGSEFFRMKVLKTYETYNEAVKDEVRLIALLKPEYNSTKGGDGGCGRVWSAESRAKISAQKKGHKYNIGIIRSEETKKKLREVGNRPESKDRWSKFAHLGPKASRKPVICLDDGMIYSSASEAAAIYGMSKSIIIEVCNKNPRRKTAGGLVFRYANDKHGGKEEADAVRAAKKENQKAASHKAHATMARKRKVQNDI